MIGQIVEKAVHSFVPRGGVLIVKAENGFIICVRRDSKSTSMCNPISLFGDIATAVQEGSNPSEILKKFSSKQELMEKTSRKQEEFYVTKSVEETVKLLSEILEEYK